MIIDQITNGNKFAIAYIKIICYIEFGFLVYKFF